MENPKLYYSDYESAGVNHTAWLLYNNKNSNEKCTLIWLTALMDNIRNSKDFWIFDEIYGFSEFFDVLLALYKEFREKNIPSWDNRSRTLIPKSILFNKHFELKDIFIVNSLKDFITILAFETIGIKSEYQLVNVELT